MPEPEALQSGLRSDTKFGAMHYCSGLHPRPSIAVPGRSPEGLTYSDRRPEGQEPAPEVAEAEARGPRHRRAQFAIEAAFEELLELERLTARAAEPEPPPGGEARAALGAEAGRLLRRLSQTLLGAEGPGSRERTASGAEPGEPPVAAAAAALRPPRLLREVLASRKGRVLLRRLLTCLAAPARQALAREAAEAAAAARGGEEGPEELLAPSLELLWQLMLALLREPGALWPRPAEEPPDQSPEDDSRPQLRAALARELGAAGPAQRPGRAAAERCAEALAALAGELDHEATVALCLTRSGAAVLRELLEGCRGAPGPGAAPEGCLDALIEQLCRAVPALHEAAAPGEGGEGLEGGAAAGGRPVAELADAVRQRDLWAMLASLTERASGAQRRRIHELIGGFALEVGARGGAEE